MALGCSRLSPEGAPRRQLLSASPPAPPLPEPLPLGPALPSSQPEGSSVSSVWTCSVPVGAHRCGVHIQAGRGGALSPTMTQGGTGTKPPFGSVTQSPRRTDGRDTKNGLLHRSPAHSPRRKQRTRRVTSEWNHKTAFESRPTMSQAANLARERGRAAPGSPTAVSPDPTDSAAGSVASPRDQPPMARATVTRAFKVPPWLFMARRRFLFLGIY